MKKILCLLIVTCMLFSACTQKEEKLYNNYNFIDQLGNEIVLPSQLKTAPLSASFADIWQLSGGTVVATTQDAWEENRISLPDEVKNVGSLKSPSAEEIISSGANFVMLSSTITGHAEIAKTLQNAGISCAFFNVETFEDYLNMLKICTDINNRPDLYQENGAAVTEKIENVLDSIDFTAAQPKILLLRAYSGGVKARNSDNMTGSMLKEMGCNNIADDNNAVLEDLTMEFIISQNPDYIFLTTMGDEDAALQSVSKLFEANPAWSQLSAVKNDNYILLPKDLFHYKPNSRWNESYEYLFETLYKQ